MNYDSDNLIYNRFDLIYIQNVEELVYEYNGEFYYVQLYIKNEKALINIWGKLFPQELFDLIIKDIFSGHPDLLCIEVTRAYNNYYGMLHEAEDILLCLPESFEELFDRIKTKHRYNFRRSKKLLEEKLGAITVEKYSGNEIVNELVDCFFEWKKHTYGTEYQLEGMEYLKKYNVTDCIYIKAGRTPVSILFYCKVEDTVYLENLSFNNVYEKYSPGFLGYVILLKELIHEKCKILFLGGGNYSYKRYFGTVVNRAYSGIIYSEQFYRLANIFMKENKIEKYAIYGLGAYGIRFMNGMHKLDAKLSYGIDREKKDIYDIKIYALENELPDVDAVFITLKQRNDELELELKNRFKQVYFWNELARNLYMTKRGLVDESNSDGG